MDTDQFWINIFSKTRFIEEEKLFLEQHVTYLIIITVNVENPGHGFPAVCGLKQEQIENWDKIQITHNAYVDTYHFGKDFGVGVPIVEEKDAISILHDRIVQIMQSVWRVFVSN